MLEKMKAGRFGDEIVIKAKAALLTPEVAEEVKPQVSEEPATEEVPNHRVAVDNDAYHYQPELDDVSEEEYTDPKFLSNLHTVVSSFAGSLVQDKGSHIYEATKQYFNQKVFSGDFYKILRTAIYKTIVTFCNFKQIEIPNKEGEGTHRGYEAPESIIGEEYEDTIKNLYALYRFKYDFSGMTEDMTNASYVTKVIHLYGWTGLQREMIPILRLEIKKRIPKISETGLDNIIDCIEYLFKVPERFFEDEDDSEEVDDDYEPEYSAGEVVATQVIDMSSSMNKRSYDAAVLDAMKDLCNPDPEESDEDPEEVVAFSAPLVNEPEEEEEEEDEVDLPGPEDDYYNYYEEEEEDEDDEEYDDIYRTPDAKSFIEIRHESTGDVVRLSYIDMYTESEEPEEVHIQFYVDNINDIDPSEIANGDIRNGELAWMQHIPASLIFKTEDPDKYLAFNDPRDYNAPQNFIVILDETDGTYTMGLYDFGGILDISDDGNLNPLPDDIMKKLNRLFIDNIAYGDISALKRSLKMNIISEEEMKEMVSIMEVDDDDDQMEVVSDNSVNDAAISALLNDINEDDQEEDDPSEEAVPEEVPAEEEPKEEVKEPEKKSNDMIFEPVRKKSK